MQVREDEALDNVQLLTKESCIEFESKYKKL